MYYEEKVINGILHCRYLPDDEFKPMTPEQITKRFEEKSRLLEAQVVPTTVAAGENPYEEILKHREKYIKAFIAETGLMPSECQIVEQHKGYETIFYLEKKIK